MSLAQEIDEALMSQMSPEEEEAVQAEFAQLQEEIGIKEVRKGSSIHIHPYISTQRMLRARPTSLISVLGRHRNSHRRYRPRRAPNLFSSSTKRKRRTGYRQDRDNEKRTSCLLWLVKDLDQCGQESSCIWVIIMKRGLKIDDDVLENVEISNLLTKSD